MSDEKPSPRSPRLYLRGRVWWGWAYDREGKRVSFSTRCTKLRAAEAALAREEKRLQGDSAPAKGKRHTLKEALDYLVQYGCADNSPATKDMYEAKGEHLKKHFGDDMNVNDLTSDLVREYIVARQKVPVENVTILKELVTLRKGLWLAKDRGFLALDPRVIVPKFKVVYKPRTRHLTEKEFKGLIGYFSDTTLQTKLGKQDTHRVVSRLKRLPWLALAVYTGGRSSEVEQLRWEEHIDLEHRTIILPGTKTQRALRKIPMSEPLAKFLEAMPNKNGPVVEPWHNQRRDLADACDALGFERVSPNDLRRTFASWMKQSGEDSWVVAQLLGHTTARMVELVYGRLNEKVMRSAIAKLPDAGLEHPVIKTDRSKGAAK